MRMSEIVEAVLNDDMPAVRAAFDLLILPRNAPIVDMPAELLRLCSRAFSRAITSLASRVRIEQ